jgi:hypothetical protein
MVKWSALKLWRSEQGLSLVDLMATLAIMGTISAIGIPLISDAVENQRLGIELRNVEREIQTARLAAVTTNRPMRMRFNCPSTGYYRRVELIGSVDAPSLGDDADNQGARRCSTALYPFPAADQDPLTRPNNDGPTLKLNSKISFAAVQTLEFWPNGTVHQANAAGNMAAWQLIPGPVSLTLTKGSTTKAIVVNSLGKIQFQ